MSETPATPERPALRHWSTLANSLIVIGGYVLSRVLGLVRDSLFARQFGTTDAADAYRAAYKLPDLLYLIIIGGALGSAFIPIFSELLTREGQERAWRMASQVMNLALLTLVAVSALVAICASPLIGLLYSAYSPEKQTLIVELTRLFLLSPLLLGLSGLAVAVLNTLDHYTLPALAPAVYNLGIIGGIIFLAPRWGVYGVAWGVIIGAVLYLLIQVPGLLRAGMRYSPTLGLRDVAVRRVAWLMAPRVFGQSAAQLNIIVMASIASSLGEGRIAALDQAYQLMLLPHGIFALSLGTVSFPTMARAYALGDMVEVRRAMRTILRTVLWMVVPSAVALAVLRVPIVRLLFQHGIFADESTALVANALLLYATALPAFAASEILIRTFYAMQDTRTPVVIGLIAVTLNIALAWILVRQLGYDHVALAGAFSVANNLEAILLTLLLRRRLGGLDPSGGLWRSARQTLIGAGIMGAVLLGVVALSQYKLPWLSAAVPGYSAGQDLAVLAGWLLLVGIVGVAIYVGIALLQGAEELQIVGGRLLRRFRQAG